MDAIKRQLVEHMLERTLPVLREKADLPKVPRLLGPEAEFCASLEWGPDFVAEALRSGYIPMGASFGGIQILLIKSHTERCVLDPSAYRPARSTVRRAAGLRLAVDENLAACLDALVAHHPDRWLTEPLCDALLSLHGSPPAAGREMRIHSIEVYREDELVAGEIGVAVGSVYTSLSGFHSRSGAGSAQLGALAELLTRAGVRTWDLGMVVGYKLQMGATLVSRPAFLARFRADRAGAAGRIEGSWDCRELLQCRRAAAAT